MKLLDAIIRDPMGCVIELAICGAVGLVLAKFLIELYKGLFQ
jgi:hypothetical protein